jgi:hypothetical protein
MLPSDLSAVEGRHDESGSADQYGDGNTAEDRENAMPAIDRLIPAAFFAAAMPIQKSPIPMD